MYIGYREGVKLGWVYLMRGYIHTESLCIGHIVCVTTCATIDFSDNKPALSYIL